MPSSSFMLFFDGYGHYGHPKKESRIKQVKLMIPISDKTELFVAPFNDRTGIQQNDKRIWINQNMAQSMVH